MPNYNTQLQTHNSDLQTVLQTLQTKASGVKLPDLTNPATESEVVVGYEVINEQGVKITGTNPYEKDATDSTVAEQADLIAQIKNAANNLPEAGSDSGGSTESGTCTLAVTFGEYVSSCALTYFTEGKGIVKVGGFDFSIANGSTAIFENVDISQVLTVSGIGRFDDLYFTHSEDILFLNQQLSEYYFLKINAKNTTVNLHIYSQD